MLKDRQARQPLASLLSWRLGKYAVRMVSPDTYWWKYTLTSRSDCSPTRTVYAGENHLPLTISRQRFHNDGALFSFNGFTTPEQVGRFRNQILYIKRAEAAELPTGEYYFHELLGLSVTDETGESLGEVTEVMETGANDVYVVTNDAGRELLLPAIAEVILDVDLVSKSMKVHLLPGLLDNGDLD